MQRDMNIPYYENIYLVVKNRRFSSVYMISEVQTNGMQM